MDDKRSFQSLASELNKPCDYEKPRTRAVKPVLVIHGGAGTMQPGTSPERQELYRAALRSALKAGYEVLDKGGEAMDAVVAAVSWMEDCPLFNCGKGAVFNVDGKQELETSIMLSKPPLSLSLPVPIPATRRGISTTLITRARNPIKLARALYLSPFFAPHTMLSGTNAEDIAEEVGGVELVDPSYFYTEARWREHRRGLGLPEEPLPNSGSSGGLSDTEMPLDLMPTGTVGAVALDAHGCICCATSTGGKTNKLVGRVGDTPIMGAGFWAEEFEVSGWVRRKLRKVFGKGKRAIGISCTGDGDYFIRRNTAATLVSRMRFLGESIEKAGQHVVEDLLEDGGIGGLIALSEDGRVALPLNCSGMYRGVMREDGVPKVAIFATEDLA